MGYKRNFKTNIQFERMTPNGEDILFKEKISNSKNNITIEFCEDQKLTFDLDNKRGYYYIYNSDNRPFARLYDYVTGKTTDIYPIINEKDILLARKIKDIHIGDSGFDALKEYGKEKYRYANYYWGDILK